MTNPADEPSEQGHIAQCLATYSLPGGQLTIQSLFTYPVLSQLSLGGPRAITDGTGEYQTARGEAVSRNQGEQTIVTIHLILAP